MSCGMEFASFVCNDTSTVFGGNDTLMIISINQSATTTTVLPSRFLVFTELLIGNMSETFQGLDDVDNPELFKSHGV